MWWLQVDTQTGDLHVPCRYNEEAGYDEWVMLIYDGLHYDALAVSAFEGAPEDLDITVLQVQYSTVQYTFCGCGSAAKVFAANACKFCEAAALFLACILARTCIFLPATIQCQAVAPCFPPLSTHPWAAACVPQVGSADAAAAAAGAEQLVAACHAARQFTDIANFTLRCGVCQIGLKGEKEAVEHAKTTGHQNFAEY
jgi:hypothetical protein